MAHYNWSTCPKATRTQIEDFVTTQEGGEWALGRLPRSHRTLVENALKMYGGERDVVFNKETLCRFADDMARRSGVRRS